MLLLERAARFGGRAASDVHARALLNQGPHALYRGGHATRTLHELGVLFRGVVPSTSAFFLERDGVRHIFPTSVTRMMSTRALSFGGKIELARTLLSLTDKLARANDSTP